MNYMIFLLIYVLTWFVICLQPESAIVYKDLPMIDKHALFQLANVINSVRESFESYQFYKIFQVLFLRCFWIEQCLANINKVIHSSIN